MVSPGVLAHRSPGKGPAPWDARRLPRAPEPDGWHKPSVSLGGVESMPRCVACRGNPSSLRSSTPPNWSRRRRWKPLAVDGPVPLKTEQPKQEHLFERLAQAVQGREVRALGGPVPTEGPSRRARTCGRILRSAPRPAPAWGKPFHRMSELGDVDWRQTTRRDTPAPHRDGERNVLVKIGITRSVGCAVSPAAPAGVASTETEPM